MNRRQFIFASGRTAWKGDKPGAFTKDADLFPTVIEGKVEGGRLRVLVHDVFNRRIVDDHSFQATIG